MAADYDVGYGRPPVAHQFKKGQSGNPSGRPKRAKSEKAVFLAIANRKVRIGGKYFTQHEVILQAMALKAMRGDSKAADTFHKIGKSLGVFDPNPPEPGKSGVIVVPATLTMEQWEEQARKQQAPYAGNETDGLVEKDQPKKAP